MELKIKKKIDFQIPEEYQETDYRDMWIQEIYPIRGYVTGTPNCHDMVLFDEDHKTYMTYCSESPFGVEIHKLFKEKRLSI